MARSPYNRGEYQYDAENADAFVDPREHGVNLRVVSILVRRSFVPLSFSRSHTDTPSTLRRNPCRKCTPNSLGYP